MGDALYDPPSHEVAGEVIDDREQVMAGSRNIEKGPVLAPDLVGLIGFIMGNLPRSFPEIRGEDPSFPLQDSIATGGADPEALVPQMATDLPGTHLRFGLLLL
jgi:hypothetical protein